MVGQTSLTNQRVAFTGKLASLTRSQAAALVERHGGAFQPTVTKDTNLLIVGQEGWPLQRDGRLSNKLVKARRLQDKGSVPRILSEDEWLAQLGLEEPADQLQQRFSMARICRLLQLPRDRLRTWMRWRLIEPIHCTQGMPYFDFRQVTGAKTLWDLIRSGVSTGRLRESLEQLARWLPSCGHSLEQLNVLERNGRLLWRLEEGQLVDPSGQMHLDFAEEPAIEVMAAPPMSAERWFQEGILLENQDALPEAIHAYRQALYSGGRRADICFNLANALAAQGQLGQAAERYRQALELDHEFVSAWNNLGNVLMELREVDEGLQAYRQALKLNERFADAHYNLGDALHSLGHIDLALRHWKKYLALEPMGQWADYARTCLAKAR